MGRGDHLPDMLRLLSNHPEGLKTVHIAQELRIARRSVYRLRDRALSAGFFVEETRGSLKLSEAQRGQVTLSSEQQLHLALLLRHLPPQEHLLFMRLISPAPPAPLPHRDSTASNPHESQSPLNPEILASLRSDHRSMIVYSGDQHTRKLECSPLATVQDRHRYLVVREHDTGEIRHLRVDHIQSIQRSGRPAERGDFHLDHHISAGWGPWGWGKEAQPICLRSTSDRAVRSIKHPSQQTERQDDGSWNVHLNLYPCREFIGWILGYAGELQVLSPDSLRELVRDAALALLAVHERSSDAQQA